MPSLCFAKTESSPLTRFAYILRGSRYCCFATKPSFLFGLRLNLASEDEKLALCKASLCAGRRPARRGIKKQRTPFGVLCFLWSGLRGSNPPPSPWQGDALPNELNPHLPSLLAWHGASGRNRTNDTRIFSPLLYQLSYRGKFKLLGLATRMGLEPTTSSVTG